MISGPGHRAVHRRAPRPGQTFRVGAGRDVVHQVAQPYVRAAGPGLRGQGAVRVPGALEGDEDVGDAGVAEVRCRAVVEDEGAAADAPGGRRQPLVPLEPLGPGRPPTVSLRNDAVIVGRPESFRSTVVYGTPVFLSSAVTALTGLSPLSTTSTLRSTRGSSAAVAPGAEAPAVIRPAAVIAAAVFLHLRARCAMVPPPDDPRHPRAVEQRTEPWESCKGASRALTGSRRV